MTVLVLRALGIGDLATGVPALRGLRRAFPDDRLVLAAPGWLAPLVDLVGGIDEQFDHDGLGPADWPVRPDVAVNLHGCGPQSHRLLRTAQPRRLMAFANEPAGHAGPDWREDEHEVLRWCRMLHWYGVECDPGDLALRHPEAPHVPAGVTIVHPGAKSPRRRWPVDRFAAVARHLADEGHHVVVTGSPGEWALAADVAARARLAADVVLAGRIDVGELAALVAGARLVISGDTGVAHLATAYGTPSVLLFGPMSPSLWGPPPDRPQHRVLWAGPVVDDGCAMPHPGLSALSVSDVLAAVRGHSAVQTVPLSVNATGWMLGPL
jgi:ADP-heptose:LPS heptosyltransferase